MGKKKKKQKPTPAQIEKWASSKGIVPGPAEDKETAEAICIVLEAEEADLRAAARARKKREARR